MKDSLLNSITDYIAASQRFHQYQQMMSQHSSEILSDVDRISFRFFECRDRLIQLGSICQESDQLSKAVQLFVTAFQRVKSNDPKAANAFCVAEKKLIHEYRQFITYGEEEETD